MLTDQLNDCKTQAEAAEILKCSEKTVGRMAAQKKIERVLRRIPGRKPMPVFNPDDIEAIRAETAQPKPFPVGKRVEEKALAPRSRQSGIDLLAQLLADRISPARAVPVEQKVFLNLKEAAGGRGKSGVRSGRGTMRGGGKGNGFRIESRARQGGTGGRR